MTLRTDTALTHGSMQARSTSVKRPRATPPRPQARMLCATRGRRLRSAARAGGCEASRPGAARGGGRGCSRGSRRGGGAPPAAGVSPARLTALAGSARLGAASRPLLAKVAWPHGPPGCVGQVARRAAALTRPAAAAPRGGAGRRGRRGRPRSRRGVIACRDLVRARHRECRQSLRSGGCGNETRTARAGGRRPRASRLRVSL